MKWAALIALVVAILVLLSERIHGDAGTALGWKSLKKLTPSEVWGALKGEY